MSSGIQTYCESVFRQPRWKSGQFLHCSGSVVNTPPFLVYAGGGPLLIVLHIKNGCGVRLFLYCNVCPERPTEDTKTAPHFLFVYIIRGAGWITHYIMGEYQDRLREHIREHNFFSNEYPDLFNTEVYRLVDFAVESLLRPNWERAAINNRLRQSGEDALIHSVVVALKEVLDQELGYGNYPEFEHRISGAISQWHDEFGVEFNNN